LETDPTRMCALLVGLPDVDVLGVGDWPLWLRVVISARLTRPTCRCGSTSHRHGVREVVLVDLPVFGGPARLVWRKQRWRCPACGVAWTEQAPSIASSRCAMTTRAARWATVQVAVVLYGEPLIDDPARFGAVSAVGLDETLFAREGPFRRQCWSTQIVDVRAGQLLDVVEGRDSVEPCRWFAARTGAWRAGIEWATLDLSSSYRSVFDTMLPDAVQVADPFHVVRLANHAVDECRRRVQNETLGHRGRRDEPLYRSRRLLTIAAERLPDHRRERLVGLLAAGDPKGEVKLTWRQGGRPPDLRPQRPNAGRAVGR
jgi:transposase